MLCSLLDACREERTLSFDTLEIVRPLMYANGEDVKPLLRKHAFRESAQPLVHTPESAPKTSVKGAVKDKVDGDASKTLLTAMLSAKGLSAGASPQVTTFLVDSMQLFALYKQVFYSHSLHVISHCLR